MCIVLLLVFYLKVYVIHIIQKYAEKKVGYWRVQVIKKQGFMLYKNVFIDTNSFFKEEEIHS